MPSTQIYHSSPIQCMMSSEQFRRSFFLQSTSLDASSLELGMSAMSFPTKAKPKTDSKSPLPRLCQSLDGLIFLKEVLKEEEMKPNQSRKNYEAKESILTRIYQTLFDIEQSFFQLQGEYPVPQQAFKGPKHSFPQSQLYQDFLEELETEYGWLIQQCERLNIKLPLSQELHKEEYSKHALIKGRQLPMQVNEVFDFSFPEGLSEKAKKKLEGRVKRWTAQLIRYNSGFKFFVELSSRAIKIKIEWTKYDFDWPEPMSSGMKNRQPSLTIPLDIDTGWMSEVHGVKFKGDASWGFVPPALLFLQQMLDCAFPLPKKKKKQKHSPEALNLYRDFHEEAGISYLIDEDYQHFRHLECLMEDIDDLTCSQLPSDWVRVGSKAKKENHPSFYSMLEVSLPMPASESKDVVPVHAPTMTYPFGGQFSVSALLNPDMDLNPECLLPFTMSPLSSQGVYGKVYKIHALDKQHDMLLKDIKELQENCIRKVQEIEFLPFLPTETAQNFEEVIKLLSFFNKGLTLEESSYRYSKEEVAWQRETYQKRLSELNSRMNKSNKFLHMGRNVMLKGTLATGLLQGEQASQMSAFIGIVEEMNSKCEQLARILYVKFITDKSTESSFAGNPERESLASNLLNLIGKRVTAPKTQILRKGGTQMRALGDFMQRAPELGALCEDVQRVNAMRSQYPAMVMERAPGYTMKEVRSVKGPSPSYHRYNMLSNPKVMAALGELFAYDLWMGNHDRLKKRIHGGNVLFNASFHKNEQKGFPTMELHDPVVSAIDNSIHAVGLYQLLEVINPTAYAKFSQNGQEDPDFERLVTSIKDKCINYDFVDSFTVNKYRELVELLRLFLKDFIAGQSSHNMLNKHFLMGELEGARFPSFLALDIGFVEGLLNLISKGSVIETLRWVNISGSEHEVNNLVTGWQLITQMIHEVGYDELVIALAEAKSTITGVE
ncbi:hypothetical protein [Aureibacter tunicatorum]|uniref:Uncharacterized protein n=1 Tax=Aureibacter tunicatorum TaxID=866807 RepID=A0AAE4BSQ1_9BACT|nr:hypothetical protein [Aureibacter tunicatorum]MDR6241449.1 hypothetical protein [Aureibacter tunicatorum]